jgi:hypothetical protein
MFFAELTTRYGPMHDQFMEMSGWVDHFRRQLEGRTTVRADLSTKLGYSLLAREQTTFEEIKAVLEEHSRGDPAWRPGNRNDLHLERQKKMVRERYGIDV